MSKDEILPLTHLDPKSTILTLKRNIKLFSTSRKGVVFFMQVAKINMQDWKQFEDQKLDFGSHIEKRKAW